MSSNSRYESARRGSVAGCVWKSPLGPLEILASARGLRVVEFVTADAVSESVMVGAEGSAEAASVVELARTQLEQYFIGQRRRFELPLDESGTSFQHAVWDQLRAIPYGSTVSYRELAATAGRPTAIRAAGAANGANPLAIVVPCHRVVGTHGSLTGYAGGTERKRFLLELESNYTAG
jgi:methylated-DNA-[protein]-cysteine S-methyltransferase